VDLYTLAKAQIRERIMGQSTEGLQRVVLFGCGPLAQLVFHSLEVTGVRILGVCDENIETIGSDFCGREVLNSSQIRFLAPDAVIIADTQRTEEIYQSLLPLTSSGIKIVRLDAQEKIEAAGKAADSLNGQTPAICYDADVNPKHINAI
jgi:hypothetical protein